MRSRSLRTENTDLMGIRVLIADDHRMMREGLRSILEKAGDIEAVGEAENGREALDLIQERPFDVAVMDISMPGVDGIEATRQIKAQNPGVKVIALSAHADKRWVLAMLGAGARGYVLKVDAGERLLRAIRCAVKGEVFLSPKVARMFARGSVYPLFSSAGPASSSLSVKEREVLRLLAQGKTSKEIAPVLKMSLSTVLAHRRSIVTKLDLHSMAELTKYAIREGLTSGDS